MYMASVMLKAESEGQPGIQHMTPTKYNLVTIAPFCLKAE